MLTFLILVISSQSLVGPPPRADDDGFDFSMDGALNDKVSSLMETLLLGEDSDHDDDMLIFETALKKDDHASVTSWLKKHKVSAFEALKKKWR